jgi:RNA polymerase sigma-70 factor (ECF subfamily)
MNTSTLSPDPEDADISDEALLIAVGNSQNVDAFNQLFKRFAKKIFALGMKLTRNEQLANDLIQESMLNVWQKAPLYDLDKGSAKGWIFTLSRNRCFDMLRKQKRQPNCISADDIWPLESGAEPTMVHEDIGGQQVELSLIESYFDQLSDPQRAVVEQIYIKDRTHEEAAAHLQIPLGTLKSRLRLGVAKLRNLIGVNE